jgi:hypothetical protein
MTTAIETRKSSGLVKSTPIVRELNRRVERAWQARNEKIARADADYVEVLRRALAALEPTAAPEASETQSAVAVDTQPSA